ncbi:DsbA family protein [Patescibacteria group bacterium]|nr:DsbA family protein [Patescibacteria group bacterium]
MIKRISAGLILCATLLTGCTSAGNTEVSILDLNRTTEITNNAEIPAVWTKGNPNAKIVLTEYSDFECPACAGYFAIVENISDEFKDDILFEFHHYPLPQHDNALIAAKAAEAAGVQGKFWEMSSLLFENQSEWAIEKHPEENFISYAEELGLDVDQFKNDILSKQIKEKISNDTKLGNQIPIMATPSFFINGQLIEAPRGQEEFEKLLKSLVSNS